MPRHYDNKEKESRLIGMPWTTATTRLQRLLLYALAGECGKLDCYRCGKKIASVKEFSIEHIISWLDNPKLYWDLSNIAFSHLDCNRRAGRKHGGGSCPVAKARWKTRFENLGGQAIAAGGSLNGSCRQEASRKIQGAKAEVTSGHQVNTPWKLRAA